MPAIYSNKKTESVLRKILRDEGFKLNRRRKYGETGVDILAEKKGEIYHIEVIGFKKSPPARSKDFFEVFFRAISRLKENAEHCVIAFPKRWERGLPYRAVQYGEAWKKIGKAFPELKIWLVDLERKTYQKTAWSEWLKAKIIINYDQRTLSRGKFKKKMENLWIRVDDFKRTARLTDSEYKTIIENHKIKTQKIKGRWYVLKESLKNIK